ncbi:3-oxoacyl-[acyl-carrier-protein] FabG [Cyphellophora attinorum]|uniref:3-oxoacyl-[acyl-carrier-protein] FabG n=1 Tax=Cyphellophora attinorum TaxID=1664694 RepID=A0A0N0NKC0_9EURO|nr:3-oxoacyl-[acyl-carrier-protein] FabG [Phialophora attinorum]KPI37858.1 3-oxoacyl-[acyl-carrier-protein] FabG [Phialophora attinorum]
MALQFEGKVAIVTGGNSGIGAATVALLAAQGAQVANLDLADAPTNPNQDSVTYYQCDVSSNDAVVEIVDAIFTKFGHIDILINNAGVMDDFSPTASVTDAAWTKVLNINLNGPFHLIRAVIPYMLRNDPKPPANAAPSFNFRGEQGPPRTPSKGSIVNLCSTASKHGAAPAQPTRSPNTLSSASPAARRGCTASKESAATPSYQAE